MMPMDKPKHATVKVGEYTVPLIGVPEDATQQECETCGQSFHISEIELAANGKACCKRCLPPNDPS